MTASSPGSFLEFTNSMFFGGVEPSHQLVVGGLELRDLRACWSGQMSAVASGSGWPPILTQKHGHRVLLGIRSGGVLLTIHAYDRHHSHLERDRGSCSQAAHRGDERRPDPWASSSLYDLPGGSPSSPSASWWRVGLILEGRRQTYAPRFPVLPLCLEEWLQEGVLVLQQTDGRRPLPRGVDQRVPTCPLRGRYSGGTGASPFPIRGTSASRPTPTRTSHPPLGFRLSLPVARRFFDLIAGATCLTWSRRDDSMLHADRDLHDLKEGSLFVRWAALVWDSPLVGRWRETLFGRCVLNVSNASASWGSGDGVQGEIGVGRAVGFALGAGCSCAPRVVRAPIPSLCTWLIHLAPWPWRE